jgi:23S rRNA pseudouridine2457 synthase
MHSTLADYIAVLDVYPAGRLDTDSEDLVSLTGDGKLQHRITDPKHKLLKTYSLQAEEVPDEAALQQLRRGVLPNDTVGRDLANRRTSPTMAAHHTDTQTKSDSDQLD